jgi:hypothetical protein
MINVLPDAAESLWRTMTGNRGMVESYTISGFDQVLIEVVQGRLDPHARR